MVVENILIKEVQRFGEDARQLINNDVDSEEEIET